MKKRTFEFDGSEGSGMAMVNIIQDYANTAYPPGGSDCAASSREALLQIATKIMNDDFVAINTRQRPMLKSALKWFYSEKPDELDETIYERLLSNLTR